MTDDELDRVIAIAVEEALRLVRLIEARVRRLETRNDGGRQPPAPAVVSPLKPH
jgi:hypothetical protein